MHHPSPWGEPTTLQSCVLSAGYWVLPGFQGSQVVPAVITVAMSHQKVSCLSSLTLSSSASFFLHLELATHSLTSPATPPCASEPHIGSQAEPSCVGHVSGWPPPAAPTPLCCEGPKLPPAPRCNPAHGAMSSPKEDYMSANARGHDTNWL